MATCLSSRWPKARKVHTCESCRRYIEVGEKYYENRSQDMGSVFTTKICEGCHGELEASDFWDDGEGWDVRRILPDSPEDGFTEHGRMAAARRDLRADERAEQRLDAHFRKQRRVGEGTRL